MCESSKERYPVLVDYYRYNVPDWYVYFDLRLLRDILDKNTLTAYANRV